MWRTQDIRRRSKPHSAVALSMGLAVMAWTVMVLAEGDTLGSAEAAVIPAEPKVKTIDLREEDLLFVAEAPIAASNNRIAVIVFDGTEEILQSVYRASQGYSSEKGGAQTYMLYAGDNDANPETITFRVYGDGFSYGEITIPAGDTDYEGIQADVKRMMLKTHDDLLDDD